MRTLPKTTSFWSFSCRSCQEVPVLQSIGDEHGMGALGDPVVHSVSHGPAAVFHGPRWFMSSSRLRAIVGRI